MELKRTLKRQVHHGYHGDMLALNDHDRGWLEMAIDGEGCLGVYKYPYRKGFTVLGMISNTDMNILNYAQSIVGGRIAYQRPGNSRHKTGHCLFWTPNLLREILPQIRLIAKERQRLLVLRALELTKNIGSRWSDCRREELLRIVHDMRILNMKGPELVNQT